jgi:hypothetical protein
VRKLTSAQAVVLSFSIFTGVVNVNSVETLFLLLLCGFGASLFRCMNSIGFVLGLFMRNWTSRFAVLIGSVSCVCFCVCGNRTSHFAVLIGSGFGLFGT